MKAQVQGMTVRESNYPLLQKFVQQAREDLPNFLSLLVFTAVTALLFRSWEFALVVTASLGFHELGHVAALAWFKLEGKIHFGVVGAWTWSSQPERAQLSQINNVYIHLAGPFFSLLLSVIAVMLNNLWQPDSRHLLILANFSAQVGLLNLLPFGPITDGGKVIWRMIASLDGERRAWAIIVPVGISVLILTLYSLVELPRMVQGEASTLLLGLLLVGVWMAASLFLEARSALRKPQWKHLHRPMTPVQVNLVTILMWDMLAACLLIISSTPFWLEPNYIFGSLQNVFDVLFILTNLI